MTNKNHQLADRKGGLDSLENELALQDALLPGVSRTFALTIPELPGRLRIAVTNAYLLCRIADTIEDDAELSAEDKQRFHDDFTAVVAGGHDAEALSRALHPVLSDQTPADERSLIAEIPTVVRITHALAAAPRAALERCVRIMCAGMPRFQRKTSIHGLGTLEDLEQYCYYVAGVVGEMLTELFAHHSVQIAANRDQMMGLAVSFGQGLQMTNILKDFWEDRRREACWLPRSVFERHGLELADADLPGHQARFNRGMEELIGVTHACLRDALAYVKLLPRSETGIRRFCLWAIGLAALTLKNIHQRPSYRRGDEVKVSRRAVKATVLLSNAMARSNTALSAAFSTVTAGLPLDRNYGARLSDESLQDTVSDPNPAE